MILGNAMNILFYILNKINIKRSSISLKKEL